MTAVQSASAWQSRGLSFGRLVMNQLFARVSATRPLLQFLRDENMYFRRQREMDATIAPLFIILVAMDSRPFSLRSIFFDQYPRKLGCEFYSSMATSHTSWLSLLITLFFYSTFWKSRQLASTRRCNFFAVVKITSVGATTFSLISAVASKGCLISSRKKNG